jgi:large-conductance mechanosensitive channel
LCSGATGRVVASRFVSSTLIECDLPRDIQLDARQSYVIVVRLIDRLIDRSICIYGSDVDEELDVQALFVYVTNDGVAWSDTGARVAVKRGTIIADRCYFIIVVFVVFFYPKLKNVLIV